MASLNGEKTGYGGVGGGVGGHVTAARGHQSGALGRQIKY